MKKTLRYVGVGLVGIAFFGSCQLLAILNSSPRDEFKFLNRSGIVQTDLLPKNTADGIVTEYRVYSWPADYRNVRDAAVAELFEKGYKLTPLPGEIAAMSDEKGKSVLILDEKSDSTTNVFDSDYETTPGWVTVVFLNPAPVNWATPIRVAFAKKL